MADFVSRRSLGLVFLRLCRIGCGGVCAVLHRIYGCDYGGGIQGVKLEDRQVRYGLAGEAAATNRVSAECRCTRVPVIIAGGYLWFLVSFRRPERYCRDSFPCDRRHFPAGRGKPDQHGLQYAAQGGVERPFQAVIGLSLLLGIALPSALSSWRAALTCSSPIRFWLGRSVW